MSRVGAVSYTHLDVYKRQGQEWQLLYYLCMSIYHVLLDTAEDTCIVGQTSMTINLCIII